MSGRNQHHIPRMMLKGFALQGRGPDDFWLYQYGATPKPVSVGIANAARGRDFYSEPAMEGATPTLDDLITEYEKNRLAPKLHALRTATPGDILSSEEVAEIAAHLIVRAAHSREVQRMMVDDLIKTIMNLQANPKFSKALIGYGKPEGDTFREQARAMLASQTDLPPDLAKRLEDAIHVFFGEFLEVRALARARAKPPPTKDFEADIEKTHRNMLAKSLVPEHHAKRLRDFVWAIHKGEENSYVLPDCIAVEFIGSNFRPCNNWDDRKPDGIVMPLSHDLLLIGRTLPEWQPPIDIVRPLVSCSSRFYYAPTNRWAAEAEFIGQAVRDVMDKAIVSAHSKSEIGKLGIPMDLDVLRPRAN